jgi:hypothetical protein
MRMDITQKTEGGIDWKDDEFGKNLGRVIHLNRKKIRLVDRKQE